MVFSSPAWVPDLIRPLEDSHSLYDFLRQENHARSSNIAPLVPLVCGVSGKAYTARQIEDRVDSLSRSLAKELGWTPSIGSAWDKVVAIFSLNTIDYLIITWAVHRLGGLCLLIHATSTCTEILKHVESIQISAVFTCSTLLATWNKLAELGYHSPSKLYILGLPTEPKSDTPVPAAFLTVEQLIQAGAEAEPVEIVNGKTDLQGDQVAYLCPTSGTSGTQKLAKITHRGLIANILQAITYESFTHHDTTEIGLEFLPLSHVYGLLLSHFMMSRGDSVVIHPEFNLQAVLKSIAQYRIERLYLVPPVIAALTQHSYLLDMFDLSSVTTIVSGAGPLTKTLVGKLQSLRPGWTILPGWGLTEGGGVSSFTSAHDPLPGSSGSLLPLVQVRLVDSEGKDVEACDAPGEIYMKSPSVIQGYYNDAEADAATFTPDGWLRTGDVGLFRASKNGIQHLFIVDRIKDMIQVRGMQVAPTDIESHLLLHDAVADSAVVGVPDAVCGEVPKAFIVLSTQAKQDGDSAELKTSIAKHVEASLSQPHWLGKRIEIVEALPKNASGKILRRSLKSQQASIATPAEEKATGTN